MAVGADPKGVAGVVSSPNWIETTVLVVSPCRPLLPTITSLLLTSRAHEGFSLQRHCLLPHSPERNRSREVTKVKTIIRVSSGRNGEMGAFVYLIHCR